jgi:hypothetical protein
VPCGDSPLTGSFGWAGGDVNGSNSQYREGDGLPYREAVTGLPNGTWVLGFVYDFTKGGIPAIDRLTTFNLTQNSDPCSTQGNPGITCSVGSPLFNFTMPSEASGAIGGFGSATPSLPNGGNLHTWSGSSPTTLSSIANNDKMFVWKDSNSGSCTATFSSAGQNFPNYNDGLVAQNGSAAAGQSSSRSFRVKFTVTGCSGNSTLGLMFAWSGHIASAADWGTGHGAASISGAPFHMGITGLDQSNATSGGEKDRSVQLSAITSTIEVKKVLSPTTDPGKFNLQIDGTTQATDVGNGGDTGPIAVTSSTGGTSHNVGEIAGTNTSLSSYNSSISCTDGTTGSNSGPLPVTIFPGENLVCTITNTQKNGTIEVIKHLSPTTDPGKFNLQIDGVTKKADAGNNDTTGAQTATPGSHNFGETAGTGTSLGDYSTTWSCNDGTSGTGTGPNSVTVASNQNLVCTITNTRKATSALAPTNTTACQFQQGTLPSLPTLASGGQLEYILKGNTINSVDPGVFFYWVQVTVAGAQTVTIHQAITSSNFGTYFALASGSFAYNANACGTTVATAMQATAQNVTVALPSAGTYIIGIKYSVGSIVRASKPSPGSNVTYTFDATGFGGSSQSLVLARKK